MSYNHFHGYNIILFVPFHLREMRILNLLKDICYDRT